MLKNYKFYLQNLDCANCAKKIENKINSLNEMLLHPTDDLPAVSLSVGGAFSECGFADELYKQADSALYEVKNHGRCGCRFYQG